MISVHFHPAQSLKLYLHCIPHCHLEEHQQPVPVVVDVDHTLHREDFDHLAPPQRQEQQQQQQLQLPPPQPAGRYFEYNSNQQSGLAGSRAHAYGLVLNHKGINIV
jgi:hypothetical protein